METPTYSNKDKTRKKKNRPPNKSVSINPDEPLNRSKVFQDLSYEEKKGCSLFWGSITELIVNYKKKEITKDEFFNSLLSI